MSSFISYRELDQLGDGIVKSYLKRSGVRGPTKCVDIEGLANSLGLEIVFVSFAEEDLDKIGFLADGKTPLKIRKDRSIVSFTFPLGTIVLDKFLHRDNESGRCRFTVAHEVAHFLLNRHIPVPSYRRVFDAERTYTCEEMHQQFNMTENQADKLAAALLMPRFIVAQALADYNNGEPVTVYGNYVYSPEVRVVIQKIAAQIGVSPTALSIRLKQLDMINNRPLSEYIENSLLAGGDV